MSEARIERIEPDPWLARTFLQRASDLLGDGSKDVLALESRQVLLHSAAIAACDAVLAIEGREVVGSAGGHQLRLAETARLLTHGQRELFERLDDARVARNHVSYAAATIARPEVDDALAAVRELFELVKAHVEPHLPDYGR